MLAGGLTEQDLVKVRNIGRQVDRGLLAGRDVEAMVTEMLVTIVSRVKEANGL